MAARASTRFTQRDVTRFVKGLQQGGVKPARVEVLKDGRISAVIDGLAPSDDDAELAELRRKNGFG